MTRGVMGWGMAMMLAAVGFQARAGTIDPGLRDILDGRADDELVSVIVVLRDQVDLAAATRQMDQERATLQRRHEFVVESLLAVAQGSQGELLAVLGDMAAEGKAFNVHAYYIRNMVRVDTYKAQIELLAARDDVQGVYYNYEVELIQPFAPDDPNGQEDDQVPAQVEIGVRAIRAPEVWALGIDGRGVLVSNTDTGVDGNHEALASRWAGVADSRYHGHPEWAWFDPTHQNDRFPYDQNGHGTHTMGTVCGGPPGREIGVAPGAYWIAAAPIDRISIPRTVADVLLSYEWFLDPDGNPSTNWDVPAVNSNSWGVTTGHGYPNCDQTFWASIDACEAAGIVMIYSAGNEGSGGLRRPADRATTEYNCMAVGAVDANDSRWPIANFSSRGPTYCTPDGRAATKPDIAAPGVNVNSSLPGNRYGQLSGTSMASPHVNGVVALMRQANPDISVNDIKQVIYETAYDLGSPGEDNSYGWGMIDAYEAVTRVMNTTTPYACCFEDGHCEDLLAQDCRAMGGTPSFGRTCGQVNCPQPGACCVTDEQCEQLTERTCASRQGTFLGVGMSCRNACPCDAVKKFTARCRANGNLTVKIVFKTPLYNGTDVRIDVNGQQFDVRVVNQKALFYACCFRSATVSMVDPGCFAPLVTNCQ